MQRYTAVQKTQMKKCFEKCTIQVKFTCSKSPVKTLAIFAIFILTGKYMLKINNRNR